MTTMQCPRCGLQNPLDITACQRCGLPVYQSPPTYPPSSQPASSSQASYRPMYEQPPPYEQQRSYPRGGYPYPGYDQPGYPQQAYQQPTYQQPANQQSAYPSAGQPAYAPLFGEATVGSPYAAASTTQDAASSRSSTLSRLCLALGALACVVYAVWALTARRSIFVDIVDNRAVSLSTAHANDRTDTVLLAIAAALAVLAMAWWLVRLIAGRATVGLLTVLGFLLCGGGLVAVVVGLVLWGLIDHGATRADEGRRAVTATIVTGSGFIALAVGLIVGMVAISARRTGDTDRQVPSATTSAAPW